jgi:hypothetical protein
MGNTDSEYIWLFVAFFGIIGFIMPYIALEFGGTVATFDVNGIAEASGLAVLNALSSIVLWTFGVNVWLNVIIFIPIRVMMYYILYKAVRGIGS